MRDPFYVRNKSTIAAHIILCQLYHTSYRNHQHFYWLCRFCTDIQQFVDHIKWLIPVTVIMFSSKSNLPVTKMSSNTMNPFNNMKKCTPEYRSRESDMRPKSYAVGQSSRSKRRTDVSRPPSIHMAIFVAVELSKAGNRSSSSSSIR